MGERVDRGLSGAFGGGATGTVAFNTALVLVFAIFYTLISTPRLRALLRRLTGERREPAVRALAVGLAVILSCLLYRPMPRTIYALEGDAALAVRVLFYAGWLLFLYCWLHLDLFEFVGLRPILRHIEGNAPEPESFRPSGPFLLVRHPVELAFLIVLWSTPRMSIGHLLFSSLITLYIFVVIDRRDRRRIDQHGEGYVGYIRRVPQIIPFPR